jgi:hypothetical protein
MFDSQYLNLPGEVLNQIYRFLLTVPPPGTPRILGVNPSLHPQILAVCRKTYREGREILYGLNTFIAHPYLLSNMPQLRRWSNPIISTELIAMIRRYHIYVRLDCDARFSAEAARDAFTGVESLTVEVFQAQFGSSNNEALKPLEKIRAVRTARVFGSVTGFPEYAAWLENAMMSSEGCEVLALQTVQ